MPVKTKSGKYVSFRYEPSYLDGSPELRTDFRRDIAPNFNIKKLVYSDINLDGGNAVFSPSKETVVISDRVFSENLKLDSYRVVVSTAHDQVSDHYPLETIYRYRSTP